MERFNGQPYQLHLQEPTPETVFQFNSGTVIYPIGKGRGVLQHPITAMITTRRGRYAVYKSLTRIDLYFNHYFWSLPENTLFEAHSSKRRKVTIK